MRCWCWGWGWWPPRSTHGALARVGGERHEHVCGSGVHVGIREHDVGGLAPELEADGLEVDEAHAIWISRPARTLPVNTILRIPMWLDMALPSGTPPCTTLTRPAGHPASSIRVTILQTESGVLWTPRGGRW